MCFFDQHRFACGDWRWGHFRQHCAKEYRMGETCGMKLVMQTIPTGTRCKLCEKIDTKMRRRQAEVDRIGRWQREGLKFRASLDKSMEVIRCLDGEIHGLDSVRPKRRDNSAAEETAPKVPGLLADRDEEDTEATHTHIVLNAEERDRKVEALKHSTKCLQESCAIIVEPSDSGYHSAEVADTASVYSLGSNGTSLSLPHDLVQEFVATFVDTLVESSGAHAWSAFVEAQMGWEKIEHTLNVLLRDFAAGLMLDSSVRITGKSPGALDLDPRTLADASRLIRRYGSEIARSLCSEMLSDRMHRSSLEDLVKDCDTPLSLSEKVGLMSMEVSDAEEVPDELVEFEESTDLVNALRHSRDQFIRSRALRRLAVDIRRQLYRDDEIEMRAIATITKETTLLNSSSGRHEATFNVHWPLKDFMRTQFGSDLPQLGAALVVSGSALYAQAATCSEYVQKTWPGYGLNVLSVINRVLHDEMKSTAASIHQSLLPETPSFSLQAEMYESRISFTAAAEDHGTLIALAQQLAWLGCALRTSPYGSDPAYFTPLFLRTGPDAFEIMFKHTPVQETVCWLPLFDGVAIATGFPIAERVNELGLEISLDLLAALSGARHVVEYDGGVLMKGYAHLFVPVKKSADSVQWHVVVSPEGARRVKYEDCVSLKMPRLLLHDVNLADATSLRAVVGWCSSVETRLGSETVTYENIDYSQAEDGTGTGPRCSGGSLGFQQIGLAQLDVQFGFKDGKCHFQRKGPFRSIARASESTLVALYDTGEKRAWLVPASQVILHMIQHRHRLAAYCSGNLDTGIKSGALGMETLLRNRAIILSEEENHTFQDEVLNIWSIFELLLEQNVVRQRNAAGISLDVTLQEHLYGFEFKAIVQDRAPLKLKRAEIKKTNGGWPLVVHEIDALVLFADGFEDVLVPSVQGHLGLCRKWERVPRDCDYLSTTTRVLLQLYDEAGSRLKRENLTSKSRIRWHQGNSLLFESCKTGQRCECDRLQQLVVQSSIGNVISPKEILAEGAVIFGRTGFGVRTERSDSGKSPIGLYRQRNVPLNSSSACERPESTLGGIETNIGDSVPLTTVTNSDSMMCPMSSQDGSTLSSAVIATSELHEDMASSHVSLEERENRIMKAMDRVRQLNEEIYELGCERTRRLQAIGH